MVCCHCNLSRVNISFVRSCRRINHLRRTFDFLPLLAFLLPSSLVQAPYRKATMAWFSPKELQQRVLASLKPVLSDLQFFACGEQQTHKAQVSSLNCEISTEASFLLTMVPWLFGVVIFLLLVIMTLLAYLIWFVKTKEESSELKKLLKELSKSNDETILTDKNSDNNEAGRLLPDRPDSNSQIGKDSGKQTKIPSFPALTTCGRVQSKMYEQTSGDDETETEKLIESKNFEILPNNDQEFVVLSPVENLINKD